MSVVDENQGGEGESMPTDAQAGGLLHLERFKRVELANEALKTLDTVQRDEKAGGQTRVMAARAVLEVCQVIGPNAVPIARQTRRQAVDDAIGRDELEQLTDLRDEIQALKATLGITDIPTDKG